MRDYSGIVFGIFLLIISNILLNKFQPDRTQADKKYRCQIMMNLDNKMPVANPEKPNGLAFIVQVGHTYYTLLNEEAAPQEEHKYQRETHTSFREAKRFLQRKGFTKVLDKKKLKENSRKDG